MQPEKILFDLLMSGDLRMEFADLAPKPKTFGYIEQVADALESIKALDRDQLEVVSIFLNQALGGREPKNPCTYEACLFEFGPDQIEQHCRSCPASPTGSNNSNLEG